MTWQYIAGFFDGEGSLAYNGKGYRITISQTNQIVLEDIKRYSGFGYVFKCKKRKAHWQDSWVYYIAKQSDVLRFVKHILPYTIVKTDKLKKAIPKLYSIVDDIIAKEKRHKKIKNKAKNLRAKGLTYREIGEKLDIDFGHARRLILKKE